GLNHLHRETHRRVNGSNASGFEGGYDCARRLVYSVAGVMEFKVRDRTRGVVDRFAIESHDKADERLRMRKEAQDVVSLAPKFRSPAVNKSNVISAGCKTHFAKLLCSQYRRRSRWGCGSSLSESFHAGMFSQLGHYSYHLS